MPTKKTMKKAAAKDKRITIIKTEEHALSDLQVYYKNPRVGNVDRIAKSLHLNGQYRAIVVNIGSKTGRANEILAGNHTYLGARKPLYWQEGKDDEGRPVTHDKPAWDSILCSFVDVDEEQAAQIMIADNKTADDGTYDEKVLLDLIANLPELQVSATGYDSKEWEELTSKLDVDIDTSELDNLEDHIESLEDENDRADKEAIRPPKFDETELGDEAEASDDAPTVTSRSKKEPEEEEDPDDPDAAQIEILDADDEIRGAYNLKSDAYFDGVGYFNIPKLRSDMLASVDDIPDTLTTWAGSATRYDDDPDTWWLYNWAVDSTSGMKDVSKVIVAFYTYDEYFEPWWFGPDKYTGKLINSGIKMALTPDFSDDTNHGRGFCMWQLFRARWIGRYMQEAGIKLIPNISWPNQDLDYLKKYTLPTLPKKIPVIAMQLQTFNKANDKDLEAREMLRAEFQAVMDHIKPEMLILYSGQPGYEWFMANIKTDAKVKFLLNRQAKLSVSRKGRKKKETI